MKHINIKIYGYVQGVSFRYYTKEKADELGINGFVENLNDGSVFIEAEGVAESLSKFLDWCYNGPAYAKVKKVDWKFSDKMVNFENFRVKGRFRRDGTF